jgi:hypothetical protein
VHGPKDRNPHSLVRGRLCRAEAFVARAQGLPPHSLVRERLRWRLVHGPRTATPLTRSLDYINYPVNNDSCAVDADSGVVLADDADAGDTASVRHNR